jgi:hypothetical protein
MEITSVQSLLNKNKKWLRHATLIYLYIHYRGPVLREHFIYDNDTNLELLLAYEIHQGAFYFFVLPILASVDHVWSYKYFDVIFVGCVETILWACSDFIDDIHTLSFLLLNVC